MSTQAIFKRLAKVRIEFIEYFLSCEFRHLIFLCGGGGEGRATSTRTAVREGDDEGDAALGRTRGTQH